MANFKISIKGLDKLSKKLDEKGFREVKQVISEEFEITAVTIDALAEQNIRKQSVNTGHLAGSQRIEGKDLNWKNINIADYSGFIEFGTKLKVKIPPEMQEEAQKFKNSKISSQSFRDAIAAWMKNKGIPMEALYPIMAKILGAGISPKPFLYPAFKEGTKNLENNIDKIIQDWLNR